MPGIVAVRKQFDELPADVKSHLRKLKPLLDSAQLEAALAYLFMMIEQGRYRAIKCGLIRTLKCDSATVDRLLKDEELTRNSFRAIMKDLLKIDVRKGGLEVLKAAEDIRDKAIHGRMPSDANLRQAISSGLEFVDLFGAKVRTKTNKNPFEDLTGLTGKLKLLNAKQSRWIVKGVFLASLKPPQAEQDA